MKCCYIGVANENKPNCTMKSSIAIATLQSSRNHLSWRIHSWKASRELVESKIMTYDSSVAMLSMQMEHIAMQFSLLFVFFSDAALLRSFFNSIKNRFQNGFLILISQLHFSLCIHCIKWNVRRTNFNVLIKLIKKSTTRFKMKPWKYATLKMNTMMMICEGIIYHLTSYKTAVNQEWPLIT